MDNFTAPHVTCAVVWSDDDLLEVQIGIYFDGWGGVEKVYVSREELADFAARLTAVAEGGSEARLAAGQEDLSYARIELFEYGAARRLGVKVELGRASDTIVNHPCPGRAVLMCAPLERGQLERFAASIQASVMRAQGEAYLPLPPDWP